MQYLQRAIENRVRALIKGFPVVVVTGPRQSGKTTFLRHAFPNYSYFNLELPNVLEKISQDPVSFLEANPQNIIIDEIQRLPDLLSYIQVHVDEEQKMGSILLSGSQNMLVSEKITQSLAGRAGYQKLFSLSYAEIKQFSNLSFDEYILKGGYPAVYTRDINVMLFFQEYIATYLERDVRQIKAIQDLLLFQKFVGLIAGRVGQLISESSLANDVGVSPNTISSWVSILEASYIIYRMPPYFTNQSKRLIKSPKIYFYDTGLLCNLLKIDNIEELKNHYLYGNIFENAVVNEFKKYYSYNMLSDKLYFYRDSNNNEIDLLIDRGTSIIPIEIKSGQTYDASFHKGLKYWRNVYNGKQQGFLIYGGTDEGKVGDDYLLNSENLLEVVIGK